MITAKPTPTISYRYFKNGKINLLLDGLLIAAIHILDSNTCSPYIKHLDVKKRYQGKGYGTMLLTTAISGMTGKEAVSLYVARSNSGAIRLYRRFGFFIAFVVTKRRGDKSYYCMTKRLLGT